MLLLTLFNRVGDEALIAIGQGCSLQHLNVSGCHLIGDAGIIAIARGCPELSYIDVSVLQVCYLSSLVSLFLFVSLCLHGCIFSAYALSNNCDLYFKGSV